MKIPVAAEEERKRIAESRELLTRLHKGEQIIAKAYNEKSVALAFEAIRLYGTISKKLFTLLEESLMLNEYLSSGRTIMVKRTGQAINIGTWCEGEMEIDPWTLQSLNMLKNVFGDDFNNFIEFKELEQE